MCVLCSCRRVAAGLDAHCADGCISLWKWLQTGKAFDLSVDTIGCAISYMDQFLSVESVDKIMMQLLSLVCVFSASKMHDPEPLSLVRMPVQMQVLAVLKSHA